MKPALKFLFATLLLAAIPTPALAYRVLDHYDLDSLVSLSDAIVRAQIGSKKEFKTADGDCFVNQIKILAVFKGNLKPGDSVKITGLDEFNHAPADPLSAAKPLQQGEEVYLFLEPNGKNGYSMYRLTDAKWSVIESGARLLDAGDVDAFVQWPAGGFIATTAPVYTKAPPLTQKIFEQYLADSQSNVVQAEKFLSGDPTPQKIADAVKWLRSRSAHLKKESATTDALGSEIARRLCPLATPQLLVSLLDDSPQNTQWQIETGLCERPGRRYLLDRVADPTEIPSRRLRFANILENASFPYTQEIAHNPLPADFDTDFESRLALLAVKNPRTDFAPVLLEGIADCSREHPITNQPLLKDLDHAETILAAAFPKAAPRQQFDYAETLMQLPGNTYHKLLPNAGPLLTLLEVDPHAKPAPNSRTLNLLCRFRSIDDSNLTLKLILQPTDNNPEIEIPLDSKIGQFHRTFGSHWNITVPLPDSVPPGKYQIFLRTYLNHQPHGDGLPLSIVLPAK